MISAISGLVDLVFAWVGCLRGTSGTLAAMVELEVADPAPEGLVLRERRFLLWLSLLDRLARMRICKF